jgi:hypothetical protein
VTEPARRIRRERSATESLLAITLALEAVLIFFLALVVFGLKLAEPLLAFGGGIAFIVVLGLDALLVRWPVGQALGWVLQIALILTGLLVPLMWGIGAGFLALWIFCFVRGRSLDRAKATYLKENAS